jgi:hypothetical protein
METVKATEIVRRLNEGRPPGEELLTYRQTDFWCRRGWLGEALRWIGSGRNREFSEAEAQVTEIMAWLVRAGMNPAAASGIAREAVLSCASRWDLGGGFLLVHQPGDELRFADGPARGQTTGDPARDRSGDPAYQAWVDQHMLAYGEPIIAGLGACCAGENDRGARKPP